MWRRTRTARASGVPGRSRMRLIDLVDDTSAGVLRGQHVPRSPLGTVIGPASLVATLRISRTAGNQIVERSTRSARPR